MHLEIGTFVDGNVKWCHFYEKQYGGSSERLKWNYV